MIFHLNNQKYWIDLFQNGYAWVNDYYESGSFFDSQFEAQKDALRHARDQRIDTEIAAEEAIDDAKYGTYEQQVNEFWKGSRL